MRALLSWDVSPSDPQLQQILVDLAALLPEGSRSLTNYTALIDPITTPAFRKLAKRLDALMDRYPDRLFVVFSLHPANSVIWGRWRDPAHALLVDDDSLGFGPGDGVNDGDGT